MPWKLLDGVRDWKAAKAKRGGGGRSTGRDFRDPGDDENPFSLDLKKEESSSEEEDSDEEESGDESDGFGGTISKKSTNKSPEEEAKEEEELAKSLGSTNLGNSASSPAASTSKPSPSSGTSTGGRGLGERKVVKSPEEIAQARAAKKVEKKPASTDSPKNLNKGAPVQMSRREREEKEKAARQAAYQARHLAGQTDEAKKDMARLAAIRKQREAQKAAKEKEAADKEAARVAGLAKSGRKIAK
ncbi:hypothetical protein JCM3765_007554 [Sporobolomyces pararoseus]